MLEGVGVEDIAFSGSFFFDVFHHRGVIDDYGWQALTFHAVGNGWIRRCSFVNLNKAVTLYRSSSCSVIGNRFAGTRGHFSVGLVESSFNLIGLSQDEANQIHGISIASRAAGNVVWRWTLAEGQSTDLHGNSPYVNLLDRIDGGTMERSGGRAEGRPHHLTGLVFWNFRLGGNHSFPLDFWTEGGGERNLAVYAKPLLVGLHGFPVDINEDCVLANEHPGEIVYPESLYEAQLRLRNRGRGPPWIDQVQKDWSSVVFRPLPSSDSTSTLLEEVFDLDDLLSDLSAILAAQKLGWALPIRFDPPVPSAVKLERDYVQLRTLLHHAFLYAVPKPLKNGGGTHYTRNKELMIRLRVTTDLITFEMPLIASSDKTRKKNEGLLRAMRSLESGCKATVKIEGKRLSLVLER
jgi:hypothetical protein